MQAGHQLVVLEVESATQCDTGLDEEAELYWKDDKARALEPCQGLKHILQRTARDCPDVRFLTLEVRPAGLRLFAVVTALHTPERIVCSCRQTQRRGRQPATS